MKSNLRLAQTKQYSAVVWIESCGTTESEKEKVKRQTGNERARKRRYIYEYIL